MIWLYRQRKSTPSSVRAQAQQAMLKLTETIEDPLLKAVLSEGHSSRMQPRTLKYSLIRKLNPSFQNARSFIQRPHHLGSQSTATSTHLPPMNPAQLCRSTSGAGVNNSCCGAELDSQWRYYSG